MAQIIGNSQILTSADGNISVTLEGCDFSVDENNTIGYQRAKNNSTNVSVDYNFFGTSIISQGRYQPKKSFSWVLAVSTEKAYALEAIRQQQLEAIRDYQNQLTSNSPTYPTIAVRLIDGRVPTFEPDTLNRSYDTGGLALPASTITGFTYRWSTYEILITDILGLDAVFQFDSDLYELTINAQELDISTGVVTNLLP